MGGVIQEKSYFIFILWYSVAFLIYKRDFNFILRIYILIIIYFFENIKLINFNTNYILPLPLS